MLSALNTQPWTRLSPRKHRGYRPVVRRRPRARTHYNYFRDYDPQTGRYIESDPIGLYGGSYSTYSYAGDSPVIFYDPTGLRCTYSQSSGSLTCVNDSTGQLYVNCTGYSGIGSGLDNPAAQPIMDVGPLPQGLYIVGYPTHRKGPLTLPLIPLSITQMYGRNGMLIHGDAVHPKAPHAASNGCIVTNKDCRAKIPPLELLEVTP